MPTTTPQPSGAASVHNSNTGNSSPASRGSMASRLSAGHQHASNTAAIGSIDAEQTATRLGTLSLGTTTPMQQPTTTPTPPSRAMHQQTGPDIEFTPEDFGLTQDALPPYSEEAPPPLPTRAQQQQHQASSTTTDTASLHSRSGTGGREGSPSSSLSAHSPRNPFINLDNAPTSPSYAPPLPSRPSSSNTHSPTAVSCAQLGSSIHPSNVPSNTTSSGTSANSSSSSNNNNSSTAAAAAAAARKEEDPVNEYVLKPIDWIDPATGIEKRIKIITQNENGPCPLLALCNTLLLQGKVEIKPYDRPSIRYDHLLGILADYLLAEGDLETNTLSPTSARSGPRVEAERQRSRYQVESALRILPRLEHGLDVNVFFKSIRGFENTPELGLFHSFGVELVHGWIVSPDLDPAMYKLVDGPAQITSYNKAVECIVNGDDAGGGWVVEDASISSGNRRNQHSQSQQGRTTHSSTDDSVRSEQISHALTVQDFLNTTSTQLTHYGLSVLHESLPEGHLCAFFRNNHFCTLFKNPMDGVLYTLVTDQSLAHELAIVWESLEDVDGAGSFLDGLFRQGALEVGDYARSTQPANHGSGHDGSLGGGGGDEDFALALQLQQQEEEEERQRRARQGQGSSNPSSSSSSSSTSPPHATLGIHPQPAPGHYQAHPIATPIPATQSLQQPYPVPGGGLATNTLLDPYMYRQETDEEMAQRLDREFQQEYLREQQQRQVRQQQQQQHQQQPQPQPQLPQQQLQQYQPPVYGRHSYEPPRGSPSQPAPSTTGSGRLNRRQRHSSDGSGSGSGSAGNSSQKDKCSIM